MEQHDDDAPWRLPVARRSVLLAGGTVAVLAGIRSAGLSLLADPVGDPTATLHLVRPQDMLVIDFDFYNLRPDLAADPALLRRIDSSVRSFIVARLDSQHVTEQTVFEGQRPPDPGSAAAKAVAGSRIAFVVPETVKSLPYSEEGLLRWWQWIMQAMRTPGVPGPLQTDLLIVDWLHISPDRLATWSHAAAPVTHGNRTELWHSRLALRGQDGRPVESLPLARPPDTAVPTVRAVHADTPTVQEKGLFQTLLPGGDDSVPGQIVQLSSNPAVDVHKPVRADLLSISAAGATVDLDGSWQPTAQPGLNVKRWDHHAWQGRDNKVVIEQYVFLVPTGHRAILVTETERLLDDQTGVAYLRQRQFIRPSERVKRFPGADQPHQGRAFPLREVTITNPVLPDLPAPAQREEVVPGSAGAYWIQDINAVRDGGHSDVVFTVVTTDLAGRRIELSTPMAYILADRAVNPADPLLAAVTARLGGYAGIVGTTPDRRRVLDLRGQQVAYVAEQAADTASFPTRRWFWGLEGSTGDPHPLVPRFYPVLLCAEAQVPAIDAVIGPGGPAYLVHDDVYLA